MATDFLKVKGAWDRSESASLFQRYLHVTLEN